jgi:ribonuclease P protein component
LSRGERVRKRPEFLANYERGSRNSSRLMTVFVLANGSATARLGIAATRKFGNAVQRNRAKRLIRETFRRHKPLVGLDIIVVPKREMLVADYRTVEADYCAILLRRRHIIREA